MHYPIIDPVILPLGGDFAIRWYGVSYLAGFAMVWWLGNLRAKTNPDNWRKEEISDLVFFGALGAVLGGRLGYVLFYKLDDLLGDPLYLFRIWEGGMSFHGGLLGVIVGIWLFARKQERPLIKVMDFLAPLCPVGLGFGRLANFINMELPGRVTDSPLGLIYPCKAVQALNLTCTTEWEPVARHPSPLYQAFTEGLLLFILVWWVSSKPRPAGMVAGTFLLGYSAFRMTTELFRSPDAHLGFIAFDWLTMGQLLSLPMFIAGILLLVWSRRQTQPAAAP